MNASGYVPSRREKKRARKVFAAFLKRVKKVAKVGGAIDQCREILEELRALLHEHGASLPPETYARLERIAQATELPRGGVGATCNILEFELGHVLTLLPASGSVGLVAGGAALVAATAVGSAAVYANTQSAEIVVRNENCQSIILSLEAIPGVGTVTQLLGFDFPLRPILAGQQAPVTLPALTVEIDGTQSGQLGLVVLGQTLPVPVWPDVMSLELDGQPLLGQRGKFHLGGDETHELIVRCRPAR